MVLGHLPIILSQSLPSPFSQVESRSRLQSCVNLRDYSVQLTCEDTVCMQFLPGTHRAKTTPGVHIKFKCFISEKLCQTLHSLPESERAHSCEMVSFHYLTLCSPSQPTLGHRWTRLARTSLMHRFRNSMGQMTFGRLFYPSSRKGKEWCFHLQCWRCSARPEDANGAREQALFPYFLCDIYCGWQFSRKNSDTVGFHGGLQRRHLVKSVWTTLCSYFPEARSWLAYPGKDFFVRLIFKWGSSTTCTSFHFLIGDKTTHDTCHSPLSHRSLAFPFLHYM